MKTSSSGIFREKELFFVASLVALLAMVSFAGTTSVRPPISSSETRFTETSVSGMNIMPASCASGPQFYHTTLPGTGDGSGYYVPNGASEYGAYAAGLYVCVTNNTGSQYFIPARTAAELQSFKNLGGSRPGLQVY